MLRRWSKGNYITMLAETKIWSLFLLIFLVAGMLYACGSPATKVPPASDTSSVQADRVEAVYFHRLQRCPGCLYAETATRFTVETYFKGELASGKLEFKVVNLSDEANTAIVSKYRAYTSSLFINNVEDGVNHIEEVNEIWFLLGKDEKFVSLVKAKIGKYLGRNS